MIAFDGTELPYGVFDLSTDIQAGDTHPLTLRCFVNGCPHFLRPSARGFKGDRCPEHGIYLSKSLTYVYADPARNAIAGRDILAKQVIGSPFKFETHRLGNECSEDTLTWNVFRSFQEAKALHLIARLITGLDLDQEPTLYLWGMNVSDDSCRPSDLLIRARERFERRLPVVRPKTEYDCALHLEGRYLALIEAKLKSPNVFATDGPRESPSSLKKSEVIRIYSDPALVMMDRKKAKEAHGIWTQLYRNVVFAEYMARLDGPRTRPFFANLTRRGREVQAASEFRQLLTPEHRGSFTHLTWEDLYVLAGLAGGRLRTLREYLLTKTLNLTPAFDFGIG